MSRYSYSFDREVWFGEFESRQVAIDHGMTAAEMHQSSVDSIYVGKRVDANPHANGHGELVIKAMRRQAALHGQPSMVDAVSEEAIDALDRDLQQVIVQWLDQHNLRPEPKLASVSEHPLPTVSQHEPSEQDEVSLIGPYQQ